MTDCFTTAIGRVLMMMLILLMSNLIQAQQVKPNYVEPFSIEQLQQLIQQLKEIENDHNNSALILQQKLELLENKLQQQALENSNLRKRLDKIQQQQKKLPEKKDQPSIDLLKKIESERVENARLIETAFEQKLIDEGGLLMRPGSFTYEPSFSVVLSSSDRIIVDGFTLLPVLVVGDITSEEIRRDIVTVLNTFRVGLPEDFQLEFQIPYSYQQQDVTSGDGEHNEINDSGLGDLSLTVSYQLVKADTFWPDTLISSTLKSKTGNDPYRINEESELSLGSGFASISLSLTSVVVSDPLAFYYGLALTQTPRDLKAIGYIKPGEAIRFHMGMSMAINLETSISFGFQASYTDETEFNGDKVPGSDYSTATFSIGVSRKMSHTTTLDLDLGIGLTRDAPDFQFSLSVPMQFF